MDSLSASSLFITEETEGVHSPITFSFGSSLNDGFVLSSELSAKIVNAKWEQKNGAKMHIENMYQRFVTNSNSLGN